MVLVVSDTSPLRALQTIDQLGLLHHLFGQVYVPPSVVAELSVATATAPPLNVVDHAYFVVRCPRDSGMVARLLEELDQGESEALALALELRAERVLIDESDGRRVARRLGLRTVGVLSLLVQSKKLGLIERVEPLISELDRKINFRISTALRRQVLDDAGE